MCYGSHASAHVYAYFHADAVASGCYFLADGSHSNPHTSNGKPDGTNSSANRAANRAANPTSDRASNRASNSASNRATNCTSNREANCTSNVQPNATNFCANRLPDGRRSRREWGYSDGGRVLARFVGVRGLHRVSYCVATCTVTLSIRV